MALKSSKNSTKKRKKRAAKVTLLQHEQELEGPNFIVKVAGDFEVGLAASCCSC